MSQTKAQLISDLVQALNFTGTASAPANGLFLSASNQLKLATASTERLKIDGTELVVNDTGASVDFRVEGDTNANLLFVDASTDRVGIGTNSVDRHFHVEGTDNVMGKFQSNQSLSLIEFEDTDTTAGNRPSVGADANNLIFFTGGSTSGGFDSSGRFGVGTLSMGTFNANADDIVINASGNGGISVITPNSNSGRIAFGDPEDNNRCQLVYSHSGNNLNFDVNGSERMRIDSSGRLLVGLTSTSLNHPLQVQGASDANAIAIIGRSADDIGELHFYENDKSTLLGEIQYRQDHANIRHRVGYLAFATGGVTERMRIDSSGNVGIGTTSPTHRLHVIGDGSNNLPLKYFRGGSGVSGYLYSDGGGSGIVGSDGNLNNTGLYFVNDTSVDLRVNGSARLLINSSGNVGIGTTSPSSVLHVDKGLSGSPLVTFHQTNGASSADAGLEVETSSTGTYIQRWKNSGSEHARITGAGLMGIGTASPSQKLEVSGNLKISSGLALLDNDQRIQWGSSNVAFIEGNDNEKLVFGVAAESMRIDSSGRLLIGTTTTDNAFSGGDSLVIGTTSDRSGITLVSSTSNDGGLYFSKGTSTNSDNVKGQLVYQHDSNGGYFRFYTNAAERMRIDSSGHLLLGTTTTGLTDFGDSLTIQDANAGMTLRVAATTQVSHIYFSDGTSGDAQYRGYVQYHHNTDHMSFGTAAIERMRIDSSGNVGIGTTSPHRTLHQHVSASTANYHQFTNSTTGSGAGDGALVGIDANENLILWNVENIPIRFGTNNTERMRILNGGNLVVNATALPVVGTEKIGVHGGTGSTSVGVAAVVTHNEGIPFFASNSSNSFSDRLMRFAAGSGGDTRGTITFNGSVMVYGGASDYRLKENITSISNGITKLKDLKPINFNWIKDETNTSIMGFLAHEVQEVMPQVVVGTKDEVNSEGKPEYQEIDLGGISPLIVAALQEAISKIETLETKVAALEAA